MKTFGQKITERDFTKRFKAIIITALIMVVVSVSSGLLLFQTQISEVIDLGKEHIREEIALEDSVLENDPDYESESSDRHIFSRGRYDSSRRHRISFLKYIDQITPVPVGTIVFFVILGLLWSALCLFCRISIMEWLYKTAVLKNLNRALWPILGLFFSIFAVFAILIVMNNPKRTAGNNIQTA